MPLDDRRRAILQRLKGMPPGSLSPNEQRLLEDLRHQQGVSSVEDAIAAGGEEELLDEAPRTIPRCPKCKGTSVTGRSTPTGKIWQCLEEGCGNSWRSSCGPTLHAAVQPLPEPNPSVPVGPESYYPSGGGPFRHPLRNRETEEQ